MQSSVIVPPSNPTLYVALSFLVVLAAAVIIFGFKRGNVFGELKFFGFKGKVDAKTPAAVRVKGASAGRSITLLDETERGVEGENLTAKGDITAKSGRNQSQFPKD